MGSGLGPHFEHLASNPSNNIKYSNRVDYLLKKKCETKKYKKSNLSHKNEIREKKHKNPLKLKNTNILKQHASYNL